MTPYKTPWWHTALQVLGIAVAISGVVILAALAHQEIELWQKMTGAAATTYFASKIISGLDRMMK